MNSVYHARSAVRKWGGIVDDYIGVEELIDSSKQFVGDARHRALFHNTYGVWLCQRVFGRTIPVEKDNGIVEVPVRLVAEQHIIEDLGWLPSPSDYFDGMPLKPWMSGAKLRDQALSSLGLHEQAGQECTCGHQEMDHGAATVDTAKSCFRCGCCWGFESKGEKEK